MIADIQLFNVPNHQLANRQFVVGNLGNPIKTVPDVKVGNGPILDVALPWDDTFSNANIVKIGSRIYDIVGIDDSTYSDKSIRLRLMYNAVTSLLRKDANGKITLNGWWERAPIPVQNGKKIAITDDTFIPTKYAYFNEPEFWGDYKRFFYQVVTNRDIQNNEESNLRFYVGFVLYKPDVLTTLEASEYAGLGTGGVTFLHIGLREMIEGLPSILNVPSDAIMDVSISPRSPYKYNKDANNYLTFTKTNGTPTEFIELTYGRATFPVIRKFIDEHPLYTASFNEPLTPFEKWCGSFYLVDERGNEILQIPNEYITDNITVNAKSISDVTGLYTVFEIGGNLYFSPEGKIPFIGSAWNDYNLRSRDYDREALIRSIENAREQRNIDMLNSIGGSMLTVGLAGAFNPAAAVAGIAQMGLGIATSEMQARLAERNLYAEQNAKEGLIKNSPSQNYQTGYGLDYLYRSFKTGGCHIRLDMPANTVEADFHNYVTYRGYPCGKYASITLPSSGYIKGNVYNDFSSIGNAVETDMLRKEIASGCRIVIA